MYTMHFTVTLPVLLWNCGTTSGSSQPLYLFYQRSSQTTLTEWEGRGGEMRSAKPVEYFLQGSENWLCALIWWDQMLRCRIFHQQIGSQISSWHHCQSAPVDLAIPSLWYTRRHNSFLWGRGTDVRSHLRKTLFCFFFVKLSLTAKSLKLCMLPFFISMNHSILLNYSIFFSFPARPPGCFAGWTLQNTAVKGKEYKKMRTTQLDWDIYFPLCPGSSQKTFRSLVGQRYLRRKTKANNANQVNWHTPMEHFLNLFHLSFWERANRKRL